MKTYSLLYSYPTWDPHYRGQRGIRVRARNEQDAINAVRKGKIVGQQAVPGAAIVRIKDVTDRRPL